MIETLFGEVEIKDGKATEVPKQAVSQCCVCGKGLSDPTSVSLGIGPVCRAKYKNIQIRDGRGQKDMFSNGADYDWGTKDNILWITDLNKGNVSVTNDIENVVKEIGTAMGGLDAIKKCKAIIYRDSMGVWDGVRIKKEIGERPVVEIYPVHTKDFEKALEYVTTGKEKGAVYER